MDTSVLNRGGARRGGPIHGEPTERDRFDTVEFVGIPMCSHLADHSLFTRPWTEYTDAPWVTEERSSSPSARSQIMLALESSDGSYASPRATVPRQQAMLRVTVVGALVDVALGTAKLAAGVTISSHALIADGVHSWSDLVTDGVVFLSTKCATSDADEEHPYGHARVETVATVVVGISLLLVALGIAIGALEQLVGTTATIAPPGWALMVAVVSIVAKEGCYRYTHRAARQYRSDLLQANAWHHRSDALSSVVVLVGMGGAMIGLSSLDALAGVGVAVMLIGVGGGLAWKGVLELVDTGLEPARVDAIGTVIEGVDGVLALHRLRTRRMGPHALVDVSVRVDGRLSVSEGHYVAERVRTRLIATFPDIADVAVHVDPEEHDRSHPVHMLPSRREILPQLQLLWQTSPVPLPTPSVVLHYLEGRLEAELTIACASTDDGTVRAHLTRGVEQLTARIPALHHVVIRGVESGPDC